MPEEVKKPVEVNMTSIQKAALVLSSIGAENASAVFKHFSDDEIEHLTLEVAKLDYWPSEQVEAVLNDFYELCLTQKVISEGGVEYAREVLEKAFGSQQASALFDKITKQLKTKAFAFVRKSDYKNLLAIVQNEHPQTIALILSYARSDQASAILPELPKDIRIDVVERMARMDSAAPDVVKSIEQTLERKYANLATMDSMEVGGVSWVADVLNSVDRTTEKFIFDELLQKDPKLAEEIRKKMFVFEDIALLDSIAIQTFLKEIDAKDLAVAIKGSNQEVAEIIYANMSSRMRETTQTDVEYLSNVRMRDVEEAQQKIVATIRRLEDENVLEINRGGADDFVA
ncbi:MAG: flagellar motor switch protein FliG [Oscillospiraceae bacterium]|nr:flagellar motor switch protein FliG [Oscillospiraceae bacterium]